MRRWVASVSLLGAGVAAGIAASAALLAGVRVMAGDGSDAVPDASRVRDAHPPEASFRAHPARIAAVGLMLAVVFAGLVAAGYQLKTDREQRAAAIALTGGNPELAPAILARYGCRGCHTIPGVPGAAGLVGPPLGDVARHVYVAGVLENTPDNLMTWIENPRSVNPRTAMPTTGITRDEARHVAAYLYSLR